MFIYAVEGINGNETAYENPNVWGQSAILAVVAIVMVFVILALIIGITALIFKWLGYIDLKKELDAAKKANIDSNSTASTSSNSVAFDTNDEDMVAAVLVATIDYQNEIKQDVKLISVKEIK